MRAQLDPRRRDKLISELAAAQHGVVTRAQLKAAGLNDGGMHHRLRARRLHRLHRGVYAVGHPILTEQGRLTAAILTCGAGAVSSHRTAADLWGIRPSQSRRIDVTVPSRGGRVPPEVIRLHRSAALPADETTVRGGISVTTLARTLLDLAAVVDLHSLARAVERAEGRRIFDLRAVEAVLAAHPGRAGSRALKAVLESYAPLGISRSDLEELFLAVCASDDLPLPLVNAYVGPYEVDFLWRAQRLAVETDSHTHHGTRAAFERDRERDARLQGAGFRVVRFTYHQVVREPGFVAGVLRSVLGAGR